MTEKNTANQNEQPIPEAILEAEQSSPEAQTTVEAEPGKVFSQVDVNRIISDRLGKERERHEKALTDALEAQKANLLQEIDTLSSELSKKENRLLCREYLVKKAYPSELLNIINTDDVNEFIKKADQTGSLIMAYEKKHLPPLKSTEPNDTNALARAFSVVKRQPKNFR